MRKTIAKTSRVKTPANPAAPLAEAPAPADLAAYIADMSRQLAGLAQDAKLEKLGCYLTLAALEASERNGSAGAG